MIDAPKYLMCWDGYPHITSLGTQKCFARFVEIEAEKGPESINSLNTEFFKHLVCKRIIFDTVYKHIKKTDWYRGAYQGNIAQYAMAKYALDLQRFHIDIDFESIWRTQRINSAMLGCLLKAAEQASAVLNDPDRPTQNVSEWAKKENCWDALRRQPTCLDADAASAMPIIAASVPVIKRTPKSKRPIAVQPQIKFTEASSTRSATPTVSRSAPSEVSFGTSLHNAEKTMCMDNWAEAAPEFCMELLTFARERKILSPKAQQSLLDIMNEDATSININALNYLLSRASKQGFKFEGPTKKIKQPSLAIEPTQKPLPSSHLEPEILTDDQTSDLRSSTDNVEYQRDFLMEISPDTWHTITTWATHHYVKMDSDLMSILSKIEKNIRLTNSQTQHLWEWRQKMIRRGFPASQFAPLPSSRR